MKRRSLVLGLGLALGALLGASCSDPSTLTPNSLNLDRPVDIAFACYGGLRLSGADPATTPSISAQPTSSCEIRSQERYYPPDGTVPPEPRPPGQEDLDGSVVGTASWYSFILQSAPGTVALALFDSKPASQFVGTTDVAVLDADALTPGKNSISIGEEPIAIETDRTGCFVVTANAGSCDMSMLGVGSAIEGTPHVDRLQVTNLAGTPIYARPAAMVGEPSDTVIGNMCPSAPTGIAYVAFPSCHMVAGLDMSDGVHAKIVSAITFDAAGVATTANAAALANLSCPAECPAPGAAPGSVLPAVTPGTRPVTLAYRLDPGGVMDPSAGGALTAPSRRLAIGASNSRALTIADLPDDPKTPPTAVTQIQLEQKPGTTLGVTQLALSAQIAMGGTHVDATAIGGIGQYVYAVATDSTVRVADVLGHNQYNGATMGPTECDTQVDTRFIQNNPIADTGQALACFPVGNPKTPPRRPGARSPGIHLIADGVPLSVAFITPPLPVDVNGGPTLPVTGPFSLYGTFAIVTTTSGATFVVNVDDDNNDGSTDTFDPTNPQATAPVLNMAHQLRDNISSVGAPATVAAPGTGSGTDATTVQVPSCLALGTTNSGGPRTTTNPVADATAGTVASSKVGELPTLRQVRCTADVDAPSGVAVSEMQLAADAQTRNLVYPDLRSVVDNENWSLIWEGALSDDTAVTAIDGPAVRTGELAIDSTAAARMDDQSHPYCSAGVEPFDVLQLRGCDPANKGFDCPSGYECYVHADSKVTIGTTALGACMQISEADRLASACRDFLISQRRYTVRHAASGELQLMPRKHELRTTPLDGCTSDTQCKALADYAVQTSHDEVDTAVDKDPHSYACLADDTRKPFANGSTQRCVQTCAFHATNSERDIDCDVGSLCVGATDGTPGVCMEGVMPPQACVNAPQRYDVRAGEAFALVGDHSGYIHPITAAGGQCVVDPTASPVQRGRVPLTAPACAAAGEVNPITGELKAAPGTFEPNPCSTTVVHTDTEQSYTGGVCTVGTGVLTDRVAPAIRLRTRGITLTLVDPYYPGDAKCPVDRGGAPGVAATDRIPLVFPGYRLVYHIASGFQPMFLQTYASVYNPVLPLKVVAGPTGSIWVLDDGDFLSSTIGLASTSGSVYRLESVALSTVNLLQ